MALPDMRIPKSGRLAIYDALNAPFRLVPYALEAPAAGAVLVKIRLSTLCRSDIHSYRGIARIPVPAYRATRSSAPSWRSVRG